MDTIEKIIEILERQDSITPSENEFIKNESDKDESVKVFIENYDKLKNLFLTSEHVDPEILGEYIFYKNDEQGAAKYLPLVSKKIEKHLQICSQCKTEFDELQNEFKLLGNHLDGRINTNSDNEQKHSIKFLRSMQQGYRVAIGAILIILAAYAGMKVTSEINTPFYEKDISYLENEQNLSTRGRTSEVFQKGISALSKGEFANAIKYLNEDIEKNSDDKSIFYSYYILGIIHLKNSVHHFLGTFYSFDSKEVSESINNFKLFIKKNNSGLYKNLILNAHYYIAVGYMIERDPDSAIKHLHIVKDEKGRFYKEATEILNSLEKN